MIIAPIVEGHGDVAALPILLRLINPALRVAQPVRFPKNRLLSKDHLSRAVAIARTNIPSPDAGVIVLMFDADTDCPATLGPPLLQVMRSSAGGAECFVAIVVREFESWIVGGHPEIDLQDCEAAGNPKDRVRHHNNNRYSETIDQPRYTAMIDIQRLRARSPSFERFVRRIEALPAQ